MSLGEQIALKALTKVVKDEVRAFHRFSADPLRSTGIDTNTTHYRHTHTHTRSVVGVQCPATGGGGGGGSGEGRSTTTHTHTHTHPTTTRRAKIDVLSDRKRTRVLATKPRVGWGRLIAQIEAGVHADFLSYFLGLEVENKIGKSGLPVQKSCVFRSASPRPRRSVGEGRPTHL